jgi:hypothetical protein
MNDKVVLNRRRAGCVETNVGDLLTVEHDVDVVAMRNGPLQVLGGDSFELFLEAILLAGPEEPAFEVIGLH